VIFLIISNTRPTVLVPSETIGWPGGDEYLYNLRRILKILENENFLSLESLTNLSSSEIQEYTLGDVRINLPWPLLSGISNPIQWIPDLQDIEEPSFFSTEELEVRKKQILNAIEINTAFYFSSNHSRNVFIDSYPGAKTLPVLRFSVANDVVSSKQVPLNCQVCIEDGYFYAPNSWWKHKNHLLLISSFREYVENGGKRHLILSGSQSDYRWPFYENQILLEIEHTPHVHNLGFVTKSQKTSLLELAFCIVQSSLYEGWATVIEEALLRGKRMIISDLPVFEEQLEMESGFLKFARRDSSSLIEALFKAEVLAPSSKTNYIFREARFLNDAKNLIAAADGHVRKNSI
jgi:glycosyltransferase involved in cell wall biosynthesis